LIFIGSITVSQGDRPSVPRGRQSVIYVRLANRIAIKSPSKNSGQ